jgi:hypothetical protein
MRYTLFALFILFSISSCIKTDEPAAASTEGHYFSIKEYAYDQWKIYHGQPFGLVKYVYMNGKTDSVYTNADAINWAAIFKIFFETDISAPKFDGKYNFSAFVDSATRTENYYYEANDPKLFTQKLHIIVNISNHRVNSIYIETNKDNKWGSKTQRLFYEPVKSISIQEFENVATGSKNEIRVEYKFM